ncbi:desampylase [soil metagenome]
MMLAVAAADSDREVCGLLFGGGDLIDSAKATRNNALDPRLNFEINAAELIDALRAERDGGPAVIGYFHSHPNGLAIPSATDRAMAAPDGRIWIIVASGAMTAWRATANGLAELPMSLSTCP